MKAPRRSRIRTRRHLLFLFTILGQVSELPQMLYASCSGSCVYRAGSTSLFKRPRRTYNYLMCSCNDAHRKSLDERRQYPSCCPEKKSLYIHSSIQHAYPSPKAPNAKRDRATKMGHSFFASSTLRYGYIILLTFGYLACCSPLQQQQQPPPLRLLTTPYACHRIGPSLSLLSPQHHPLNLTIDHTSWTLTPTLSLALTICNWEPAPATIRAVLAAAAQTAGKRPADALVEKKWVVRSDNKYNTLYFEIGPQQGAGGQRKLLTWGDVGAVLGERRGLVRFFEETGNWHTVYFAVVDKGRGVLGEGAVRRWWQ